MHNYNRRTERFRSTEIFISKRGRQRRRKDGEKEKGGGYKNQIVQEKIEHERETDATLTKGRENNNHEKNNLCYCLYTMQYVKHHCVAGYLAS